MLGLGNNRNSHGFLLKKLCATKLWHVYDIMSHNALLKQWCFLLGTKVVIFNGLLINCIHNW